MRRGPLVVATGVAAALVVTAVTVAAATGADGGREPAARPPTSTSTARSAPRPAVLPGAAERSAAGARAAALAALAAGPALAALDEPAAAAAQRELASAAAGDDLVAALARQRAALAAGFGPGAVRWWVAPLAARVGHADPGAAAVEVWYVRVVAPPRQAAYAEWRLASYRLVWERRAWRVAAESDGPVPRPGAPPLSQPEGPGALVAALEGFEAPGAGR